MAAKTPKTRYIVLRQGVEAGYWEQLTGEYEGHSADEALKTAETKVGGGEGDRWVAIPVSSWRVAKVVTETNPKTSVVFETAARTRRTAEAAPA